MRSAGCNAIARPVFGMTEIIPIAATLSSYLWDTTLDESAKKALASEQSIADVLRDQKLSVESIPEDWFTTSEVHLSSPAEADLVVMGTHFARGAYTSTFWVLRKLQGGYRVVLRDNAHDVELQKTRTNGLRSIRSVIVALRSAQRLSTNLMEKPTKLQGA